MLNERPATEETGLNFLPVPYYYYFAGSSSQGKAVVSGSLQRSGKIITADKQRDYNARHTRCIRRNYSSNWIQFWAFMSVCVHVLDM